MSAPVPAGAPPPAPPSGSAPPPVAAAAPAPSPPTTVTPAPSSVPPPASSSPPSLPSPPPTVTESPPSAPSQSPGASTASPPPSPASGSSSPPPPHGSATKNLSPPPPSKHGGRSPPPPHRSSSPPSSHSSGGGGVSTALVIGIAAAGVIAVIVIVTVAICCRKRKRRGYVPGQYHVDPPHPYKEDYYGGPLQHWQQNAPPPMDHIKKIPPPLPPAPPPAMSIRPSSSPAVFPPPPPPPPPLVGTSSGENSSSGFSRSHHPLPPPSPGLSLGFSKSMFTYEDLEAATGGFSGANLLGQGGFGCVYKGILPDGQLIAVKQLKVGGGQGEREFQAEVEIISRVHHRHLVSLVGYCITGLQRILAYEFVSNNTLEYHLHGKGRPSMDWSTRLKIALGAARGLAYLHEDCYPRIIHRDIKSSNILLDDNFEAKVSDFGLAKLASDGFTHVSTRVMGTFGYLAPEYASSGKLTEKSDVFSFGVVLLELITGRRPVDPTESYFEDSLVEWARPLLTRALEDGNLDALVDPRLQNNYDMDKMMRVVASAAACVRHSARRRPRMGQIVRALEGDAAISDLNKGVRPGHSTVYGSFGSSDYDSSQYSEDMKRFRKVALASQEYGSEYSGHTSEYGLNPSVSSSEYQQSKEIELSTGRSNHSRQTGNRKHHSGINGERFSEKETETPPNMSSKFVNQ